MVKLKPNSIYIIKSQEEWDWFGKFAGAVPFKIASSYPKYEELRTFGCSIVLEDDYPAFNTGADGKVDGYCRVHWYKSKPEYSDYEHINVSEIMEQEENKENNMEEEDKKYCHVCGKELTDDDDYNTNRHGEHLCEDCENNGYSFCEDCGAITDDLTCVNDGYKYVCDDCLDRYYRQCDDCNGWYSYEDTYITYNGNYICRDCREDHYYYCDECGDYVHGDDCHYSEREDRYYCPHCWDNRPDEVIGSYHSHGIPAYYNNNSMVYNSKEFEGGYGFELEVDDGDDPDECANELDQLLTDRAWFETDGSLSSEGFEIITAPHTRLAMERDFPLDEMCDILRQYHYKSHDAGCCGLHVHVSRSLFGNTEHDQITNLAKMIVFYEQFWSDLVKVSRRKYFNYCYKMSNDDDTLSEEDAIDIMKVNIENNRKYDRERYYCINLQNANTIEFRLMRGTLNKDTLKACLDFTMTIVENCKDIPMSEVCNKDLWLKGLKETTINYLRKRKAFGYTLEEDDYDTENE